MVSSVKAGGKMNQTISYGYTGSGPATISNPNSSRGQVMVTLPALSWNFLREKLVPLSHRLVESCILKLLFLKILPMPPYNRVHACRCVSNTRILSFLCPPCPTLYNTRKKRVLEFCCLQEPLVLVCSPTFHFCNKTYFTWFIPESVLNTNCCYWFYILQPFQVSQMSGR